MAERGDSHVRVSLGRWPATTGAKEAAGLPFGCAVRPFEGGAARGAGPDLPAEDVARCGECAAYVSGYCAVERDGWSCALCGAYTSFAAALGGSAGRPAAASRYRKPARQRAELPELATATYETLVAEETVGKDSVPVVIALVDTTASEDFVELVRSALLAALEGVGGAARVGLVTFGARVGLYDPIGPAARYVGCIDDAAPLADALALDRLLVNVGENKEELAAVLEALQPSSAHERATAARLLGGEEGAVAGVRGYGPALDALLTYLGASELGGSPLGDEEDDVSADVTQRFASVRVISFLAGPPDLGRGALSASRYEDAQALGPSEGAAAAADALLAPETDFYAEVAARAASAGIVLDLCVVSDEYVDLGSLAPLARQSGGALLWYSASEEAPLPRDVYRLLSRPTALHGTLRLRVPPELRVARAYGHLFADEQYENLYHVIACGPHDSFAFDFEYTSGAGFEKEPDIAPALQLAFEYTVLLPPGEGRETYVRQRRRRVCNAQVHLAKRRVDVFNSVDADVVATLLAHKVVRASLEEGLAEAKALLSDWLVILASNYNEEFRTDRTDASFAQCVALQALPRLVFALLRSPLLRCNGARPNERAYYQQLVGTLAPAFLVRALYPALSSYTGPDELAFPQHSLSHAALTTSGSAIFLLDAYSDVIVYYAPPAEGAEAPPCPPPQKSALRRVINAVREERAVTPRVTYVRGGADDPTAFTRWLLEEADESMGQEGISFVQFLQLIARQTDEYASAS